MKLKSIITAVALAASAPFAMAVVCTSTTGLGDLTPPDTASIGASYTTTGTRTISDPRVHG